MKIKILLGATLIVLVASLNGCEKTTNKSTNNESINELTVKNNLQVVTFTEELQELAKGLSYVSYEGDYGFENFIENGGAASETELIQFLMENVILDAKDLSFEDEIFGCSTVSVQNQQGEWLFGRNFDWQNSNALILKSIPENGYASISTVNTDFIKQGTGLASIALKDERIMTLAGLYAPLDGMNEKGFAISVNMIQDGAKIEQNTGKPDLTTTTAIRLLLNNAATVDEAIALLESYDMHGSMGMMVHFAMADKNGRSVVIEYINNEMVVIETPVVTNFYLAPGEKNGIGTEQSHKRYEILMDTITDNQLSMDEVKDALDSVSKDNFNDSSTTEWSVIFNQNTGEVHYYHREDYSNGYLFKLEED